MEKIALFGSISSKSIAIHHWKFSGHAAIAPMRLRGGPRQKQEGEKKCQMLVRKLAVRIT